MRFAPTLALAVFAACTPLQRAPEGFSDHVYFGRAIPGGGQVGDGDWQRFLDEVITPAFPEGLTWWPARGQWRDPSGQLVLESTVVLAVHHRGGARTDSALAAIAAEYRRRFRQDAVLRVRFRSGMRFYQDTLLH